MNLVLMGVAGSGKTTVGQKLAAALGGSWRFADADDFHPPANIDKMSSGLPLEDADRWPWLDALRGHLDACAVRGEFVVLACSALKAAYRRQLAAARGGTRMIYLRGDPAAFRRRLRARTGHYLKADLLDSQFAALEEPEPAAALIIDATQPTDEIVGRIIAELSKRQ